MRRRLDRSGSVLIEFALIAPILMTLLLGCFDLGPALMAKFKLSSATQTVADLASQSSTMQTSDIANFFAAGGDVMAPFSASTLVLRITSVATDGLGRSFVYWSCGQGVLPPLAARSLVLTTPNGTLVTNLLQTLPGISGTYILNGNDTSYVMVESQYTFTPPAGLVLKTAQTLTGLALTMPRVSTYVGYTTGSANYTPTRPTLILNTTVVTVNTVTCNIGT